MELPTYMLLTRLVQICCCTVIIASNGWLIDLIRNGRLGLATNMIVIETMAGIVLAYTATTVAVLHFQRKSTQRRYLAIFVTGDCLSVGICIALILIFHFAGVPNNCSGMTRANWNPGDAPNDPAPGYTTIRFGPTNAGEYGELDMYCDIPIACYGICFILTFTYLISISLAFLRILSYRTPQIARHCDEVEDIPKQSPYGTTKLVFSVKDGPLKTKTPTVSTFSSVPVSSASSYNPVDGNHVAYPPIRDASRDGINGDKGMDPPPYMPALEGHRMTGHADESNETRPSGYVKGTSPRNT